MRKSSNWRQVNHPSPGGEDIPVLYSAINIGRDDRFVVVGRDLRPLAVMQQRLINAQQSMERDYIRLRHAETRYRLLFQVSSEAVMIVDAGNNIDPRRQSGGACAVRRKRAAAAQVVFARPFRCGRAAGDRYAAGGSSRDRPRQQRARATLEQPARMQRRRIAVPSGERVTVSRPLILGRVGVRKALR